MSSSAVSDVLFWVFAVVAVTSAWLVFRVDSMVRAAFWLLASFVAVGLVLLLLRAEFLGLVLVLMMAGEMTTMAVFMVMFMMNPAGLNPMSMVHQQRTAVAAGVVSFLALASVGLLVDFPDRPVRGDRQVTAELGTELMGDSMVIFETAGVALLTTMIAAVALAARRGRFGDAWDDSVPPELDEAGPPGDRPEAEPDEEEAMAYDHGHGGHGHGGHGHGGHG